MCDFSIMFQLALFGQLRFFQVICHNPDDLAICFKTSDYVTKTRRAIVMFSLSFWIKKTPGINYLHNSNCSWIQMSLLSDSHCFPFWRTSFPLQISFGLSSCFPLLAKQTCLFCCLGFGINLLKKPSHMELIQ